MSENVKKEPDIRFEGFVDDWEERKLSTEFEKVNERNDGSLGREHWISVAKMYYQSPDKVQSNNIDTRTFVMKKGDIAFEGHPNKEFKFGRFVANDIGTGVVSELFPIYRHKQDYNNYYWKNAIQIERIMGPIFAKSITSSGNSSNKLDANHFLRQQIFIPNLEEQNKIGFFFKQLDNTIALHQQKLELLKKTKKGYLQKMFPKNGETVPEMRFDGFRDEWEEKALGSILEEKNIQHPQSKEYPLVSFTAEKGVTSKTERYDREQLVRGDKINKKYKATEMNDIVYNPANLKFGAIALNRYGKAVFSPIYITFVVNKNIAYPNYVEKFITRTDFIKYSLRYQQGTVYERQSVNPEALLSMKIPLPSKEEQLKIGNLFDKLEEDIDLLLKKIEALKSLKKSLLQKMFI